MAIDLGALFSQESAFGQILTYGVMQQVIEAVIGPALAVTTQDINSADPVIPLSPADLADLVVRTFIDVGQAATIAAKSGVSASDFALMVKGAGDALDTTSLVEAYRRKIIPRDAGSPEGVGLVQGIAQGRLDPKWTPVVEGLGSVPLSPADAVDAVVENQITFAEGADWAYQNGYSGAVFQILVNTRGNPPAPSELAEMVRRGIIPNTGVGPDVTSFQQGISEGATKNKWTGPLAGLQVQLVPEGRVTTLLRVGAIDLATALKWFQLLGYDQSAAEAFAKEAQTAKTTSDKNLAKSDVLKLYTDSAIDRATAASMLGPLGYDAQTAEEILEISDLHTQVAAVDAALSRIKSYYIARKLSDADLVNVFNQLTIPPAQQTLLKSTWDIDRTSNVKLMTEAQITDAWEYQLLSTVDALGYLESLGYTPLDAWFVLSIKNKGALTDVPAPPINQIA